MDVKEIFAIVWRRRLVVAVVLIAIVGAATAYALTQPAHYESTATIALTPDTAQSTGVLSGENLATLLATYAGIAKSGLNVQQAERALGRRLRSSIDTGAPAGGGILRIVANSTDPAAAAADAQAVAEAFQARISRNHLVIPTLIDPPQRPRTPVQPRPALIISAAILLGLFTGFLVAVGFDKLRHRIEGSADLDGITSAPIIGHVPRQRMLSHRDPALIWEGEAGVWLRESFRAMRTDLQFLTSGEHTVIQFTSPTAGAGKSTIVANLGVGFAQLGIETVIVDADMRRPMQHRIFGLGNARGLSTTLASAGIVEPQQTAVPNLRVVTSGPIPPDPTELLHIRFARALDGLRATDGFVLVDSPPVLPVSDARLIAAHVASTVVVLRTGGEKPSELERTVERLALVDARITGIILNMVGGDREAKGGYGYERHQEPDPMPTFDRPPVVDVR